MNGLYEGLFDMNAGGVGYTRISEQDSQEDAIAKALEARANMYEGGKD